MSEPESPPLDQLRFVERADVYKKGDPAAALQRTEAGTALVYRPDYAGQALGSTLPVKSPPPPRAGGAVPPFFAGLLPEGRRLVALHLALKTSVDDELSLLLAVGHDAIGDVQVVPEGDEPRRRTAMVDDASLAEQRYAELFERASGASLDRVGLPGVQDKVSATSLGSFPAQIGARSCILKLPSDEFPYLVANEAFFLEGARKCGLDVARTRVVQDADGVDLLLVERFDRADVHPSNSESEAMPTTMLAQEDGCQASNRYPADKYAIPAEAVVSRLSSLCAAPRVAARQFLRQVAYSYLIGNGDLHAKNLSIVERDGEYVASPAYDIVSTHPYGDTTMALPIAGKDRENITRRTLLEFAASCDLPQRAATSTLDALLGRFDAAVLDRLDALPFAQQARNRLRRLMRDRCRKLA